MKPIDLTHLDSVRGGFGALIGSLAQSAGPILNGVANIIGASKSGGGGGQAQAEAQAPAPQSSGGGGGGGSLVSVSVNWNGTQTSTQVAG